MTAPRAVLLDALGTLLALSPPAPRLRDQLRARFGIEVDAATARRAMEEEIAYYRAHHLEGGDEAGLAALRRRCAGVLATALGPPAADLPVAAMEEALLESLHFEPYPEVPAALRCLRAAGVRLVAVSNWDRSLHEVLGRTGLAPHLDGAVASAEVGTAKPDRRIFAHALELAGVDAPAALHVGDSVRQDVEGARAAGLEAVLLRRDGGAAPPVPVRVVASLCELTGIAA